MEAPRLDRRTFLGALGTALVAPAAPRRVYSFLWDNPLVAPASVVLSSGGVLYIRERVHRPFYDTLISPVEGAGKWLLP